MLCPISRLRRNNFSGVPLSRMAKNANHPSGTTRNPGWWVRGMGVMKFKKSVVLVRNNEGSRTMHSGIVRCHSKYLEEAAMCSYIEFKVVKTGQTLPNFRQATVI